MSLWSRFVTWLSFQPKVYEVTYYDRPDVKAAMEAAMYRAAAREHDDMDGYEASWKERQAEDWESRGRLIGVPDQPAFVPDDYHPQKTASELGVSMKAPRKPSKAKAPKKATPVAPKAKKPRKSLPVKPQRVPKGKQRTAKRATKK